MRARVRVRVRVRVRANRIAAECTLPRWAGEVLTARARADDLGGDHQARAVGAPCEPLANDLFGAAEPLLHARHRIHLGLQGLGSG